MHWILLLLLLPLPMAQAIAEEPEDLNLLSLERSIALICNSTHSLPDRLAAAGNWLERSAVPFWHNAYQSDPLRTNAALESLTHWVIAGLRQSYLSSDQQTARSEPQAVDPLFEIDARTYLKAAVETFGRLEGIGVHGSHLEILIYSWIWPAIGPAPAAQSDPSKVLSSEQSAMHYELTRLMVTVGKRGKTLPLTVGWHLHWQLIAQGQMAVASPFAQHFDHSYQGVLGAYTMLALAEMVQSWKGYRRDGNEVHSRLVQNAMLVLYDSGYISNAITQTTSVQLGIAIFADWFRFLMSVFDGKPPAQHMRSFVEVIDHYFLTFAVGALQDFAEPRFLEFHEVVRLLASAHFNLLHGNSRLEAINNYENLSARVELETISRIEALQDLSSSQIQSLTTDPQLSAELAKYVGKVAIELALLTCSGVAPQFQVQVRQLLAASFGTQFMRDAYAAAYSNLPKVLQESPRYEPLRSHLEWANRQLSEVRPGEAAAVRLPQELFGRKRLESSNALRSRLEPQLRSRGISLRGL